MKDGHMKYGYSQGDMTAKVEDYSKPESCYSQAYNQAPLDYVERQDSIQKAEGSKLKKESFYGRYK